MNRLPSPPFTLRLLAGLTLAGQSLAAPVTLDTVSVQAETPTLDKVVHHEALQKTLARDLGDVYRTDAEISVGGGGNPAAQKVYIRGMEESLLNLSVDGAPINGNVYHHQSALIIDPQLLKTVQVEKGTAAASAGPGALGGAIRMETLDGRDWLGTDGRLAGLLSAGAFSNEGWRGSGALAARLGERADALLSLSQLDTQDYRDGQGQTAAHSATGQKHVLAKLGWDLAAGQRVSASYQQSRDEGVRNTRANMQTFLFGPLPNAPIPQTLDRSTSTLKYRGEKLGWLDLAEVNAYHTLVESGRSLATGPIYPKGHEGGEDLTTQGVDLKLQSRLGAHLIRYGLNWRDDESRTRNIADPFGLTGSGKESNQVRGGYVEGVFDVAPLSLYAGLRYDRYHYTDNHGQGFRSEGTSPSAGVDWQATDALTLRLNHARALRGVGMKESFMLDVARWRNQEQIDPERARNTELGFRYGQGEWSVAGNVYRQQILDYIDIGEDGRGNVGDATIKGYELSTEYRRGGFSAGLSVAYSRPRLNGQPFDDSTLGLGTSYGRTWVSRAAYRWETVELGWNGRFVESLDYTPAGSSDGVQRTKAGYGVHDVYLEWRPLKKDALNLRLAVKNLFDKQYYDQASYGYNASSRFQRVLGYAEPGRDVRLEASYRF